MRDYDNHLLQQWCRRSARHWQCRIGTGHNSRWRSCTVRWPKSFRCHRADRLSASARFRHLHDDRGHLRRTASGQDVHKCTSLLCAICLRNTRRNCEVFHEHDDSDTEFHGQHRYSGFELGGFRKLSGMTMIWNRLIPLLGSVQSFSIQKLHNGLNVGTKRRLRKSAMMWGLSWLGTYRIQTALASTISSTS